MITNNQSFKHIQKSNNAVAVSEKYELQPSHPNPNNIANLMEQLVYHYRYGFPKDSKSVD